ncbi:MAG TPA: hypothetical protein VI386_03510 [Candidatus Sulfotelmatobacter sp.]
MARVALDSDAGSNRVNELSSSQTTSILSVRDYGVTCSGSTDDTTAMQNAINVACNTGGRGKTLTLGNSCNVKLTSGLRITKCSGITVDGGQSQGEASIGSAGGAESGNAALLWYGPEGGTVLEINQTRDSVFKNLTVFANASNYKAHGANTGILIDETTPVTNIVTNNHFNNVQVVNYSTNSSFIGIDICPTAPGNCEAQNFDRLFLACAGHPPASSSSNGTGIKYEGAKGAEPYFEYIHWLEDSNCSPGIDVETTNILDIDGGLAAANWTDLLLNGGRNISYRHVRSEEGKAQIVIGNPSYSGAHDLTVEENSFSGLTNHTTSISYSYSDTGGIIRLIKNDWDSNPTVTPFGPTGKGMFVGTFDSQDNNYPNATRCPISSLAFAASYSSTTDTNCFPRLTEFSKLPQCKSNIERHQQAITDSTTVSWGAIITGGGKNHVLAYCDGTHWTVSAH